MYKQAKTKKLKQAEFTNISGLSARLGETTVSPTTSGPFDESMLEIQEDGSVQHRLSSFPIGGEETKAASVTPKSFAQPTLPTFGVSTLTSAAASDTTDTSKPNLFRPAQVSFGSSSNWGGSPSVTSLASTSIKNQTNADTAPAPAFGQTSSLGSGFGATKAAFGNIGQSSVPAFGQTSSLGSEGSSPKHIIIWAAPQPMAPVTSPFMQNSSNNYGFAAAAQHGATFGTLHQSLEASSIFGSSQPNMPNTASSKFEIQSSIDDRIIDSDDENQPTKSIYNVPGLAEDSD